MNAKYNILWLDDEPIEALPIIKTKYPQLDIEKVEYVDVFEDILDSDADNYQAVILDANGLRSSATDMAANKHGFLNLVKTSLQKGLSVYVFSGQLERASEGDIADIVLSELQDRGIHQGVNYFAKSGGPYEMLNKIISDLNNKFSVFHKYPVVLDNVLHYGVHEDTTKRVLLWIEDKEHNPFPEYVALRRVIFDDAINGRLYSFFGLNKDVDKLDWYKMTPKCISPWERDTIHSLFKNLISSNIHGWPSDNISMQYVMAHSFIIAMNWFNRLMHEIERDANPVNYYSEARITEIKEDKSGEVTNTRPLPRPELSKTEDASKVGVVEPDGKGFYRVGYYLLRNDWAVRHLGKKVRVEKEEWVKYRKVATSLTVLDEVHKPTLGDNPAFAALKSMK